MARCVSAILLIPNCCTYVPHPHTHTLVEHRYEIKSLLKTSEIKWNLSFFFKVNFDAYPHQKIKVWWPYATLFVYFYYSVTIHTFIQSFTHNIRWGPSPYLHSCRLSGRNLPGVPSRDSNSGLPYSKPAHYQLSCAAPCVCSFYFEQCRV